MSIWQTVILASSCVMALKLAGYLVLPTVLERPTPARVSNLLTVALLASIVVVQAFTTGHDIDVDARVPALVVAAGLYALKVPFVVVIIVAAAVAAGIRLIT